MRYLIPGLLCLLLLGAGLVQAQQDDPPTLTIRQAQYYSTPPGACPDEGYLPARLSIGAYGAPLLDELYVFAAPDPSAEIVARVPRDAAFLVLDGPACAESPLGAVRWWRVWVADDDALGWVGASDGTSYTTEPAPNPRPGTVLEILPAQRALSGIYQAETPTRDLPAGTRLDARFVTPARPVLQLLSVFELQPDETVRQGEQLSRFQITIDGEFRIEGRNNAPGPLVITYRLPEDWRAVVEMAPINEGPAGAFGANTSRPIVPRPTPTPAANMRETRPGLGGAVATPED